jgi:DNA processing protein
VALEHQARDRRRLIDLLSLEDGALIAALGGRRRKELSGAIADVRGDRRPRHANAAEICIHDPCYPSALRGCVAPCMLSLAGRSELLEALSGAGVVAILGSERASHYGVTVARSLGRGLAAAGVCVVSAAREGIGAAAQEGVLEADGAGVTVCGDGLEVATPRGLAPLRRRIASRGCLLSELPSDTGGRRWGPIAAQRTIVGLASVAVVVEACDTSADLFGAHLTRRAGRVLAAVPGRITSPLSRGCHALLSDGACLIGDAGDVLELLPAPDGVSRPRPTWTPTPRTRLDPSLAGVLERVAAGRDTPEELADEVGISEALSALGELELLGLLVRGVGGHYLPRDPPPAAGPDFDRHGSG